MDPFGALAKMVCDRLEHAFISKWLKLIFEIVMSNYVTYLVVTGGALFSGASYNVARGLGMGAMAAITGAFLRRERSGLTAGMFFVFPEVQAEQEIKTDIEVLQKPDKEK